MKIEQIARECAEKFGEWNGWDTDEQGPNGNDAEDERQFWRSVANHVANAILEEAAKEIAPKEERPCSCDTCDCGNSGDFRAVAYWDECNANAEAIRKLKS